MIHVLCLETITKEHVQMIKKNLEGFCFYHASEPLSDEIFKKIEIVIGNPTKEIMDKLPNLKWIQSVFAGVDAIIRQGIPEGVILTNARGAFGKSIAEHMLAMTLMLYKKLDGYYTQKKAHIWEDLGKEKTLFGKRVLIIGAGNIGQSFAHLLTVFGTTTIGVRRKEGALLSNFSKMYSFETLKGGELEQEIALADVVALSLPSTGKTKGFFNYNYLKHLKKEALVINVGRGNVMPTADICKIVEEREDVFFALDVFEEEPLAAENPLWDNERVMITPHITGGSFGHLEETEEHIFDIVRKNLVNFKEDQELINVVDQQQGY